MTPDALWQGEGVERKAEPTAFLRRGTNIPWVTLTPCGPSLGFSFPRLYQLGPGWDAGMRSTPPGLVPSLHQAPHDFQESPLLKGSYPPSEPCCLQGRTRGLRRPGKTLPPGSGHSGRDASRLPGKARPPHSAPHSAPASSASAPLAAAPLADARSAGPPRSQSRPGGGVPGSAGCFHPLRPDAPLDRAAPATRGAPGREEPVMQEPLLGAEGRDYDTFPEKPPPSPGERTRVG